MNANELAEELQKMFVGEEYDRLVHEIPDLLRQQQAEIERLIGAKPITYGMLTFCKNCGQQNSYFEAKPAKYSAEWWKEVEEFNKQLKAQEK